MENKEVTEQHMAYMDDIMYLPLQYHNNIAEQPYFQGRGNHSVKELEDLCEKFMEYTHQQEVIKQNAMKRVVENKFNLKFGDC